MLCLPGALSFRAGGVVWFLEGIYNVYTTPKGVLYWTVRRNFDCPFLRNMSRDTI
jgi:hypothetical protein